MTGQAASGQLGARTNGPLPPAGHPAGPGHLAGAGRLAEADDLAGADHLAAAHARKLRAFLAAEGCAAVLLDGSKDPNSGVTVLVIPPGADGPELAVKIATTPAAARVISGEARLLRALRRRELRGIEATIPRHEGVFDADGMLAVAASVVPGVPMSTEYHAYRHVARPAAVRADFTAAANWLAALQAGSAAPPAPIALLDGVAERIIARWPGDGQADELAQRLGPLAARLTAATIPRTVVHGDFWAGNLLVTRGVVTGVVDWAAGELAGEPLRDIVRFALSYSLYLDRHTRPGQPVAGHPGLRADGWGAGIRHAIAGQHWYGHVVRDFVACALARLGAPAGLWRAALLAGLAEVAVTADHPDFAARHRDLLLRLLSEVPQ
jgi:Phosphotransferase enzyme family